MAGQTIACKRWVRFRRAHGVRTADPETYLQFNRTGLLVGLGDRGMRPFVAPPVGPALMLHRSDALGLGLRGDDFADGVAVCSGGSDEHVGWSCTSVHVMGVEDDESRGVMLNRWTIDNWLHA